MAFTNEVLLLSETRARVVIGGAVYYVKRVEPAREDYDG